MKKLLFVFLLLFALVGCKDDGCETLVDNIKIAESTYAANPSIENCYAYRTLLEEYITSSCEHEDPQVNLRFIFEADLEALPCAIDTVVPPPPPAPATCDDGIMNGDETGIDCGGSACLPCATIFISYEVAGESYNHEPTQYSTYTGTSPEPNHNITSGNIINATTTEGRLSFNFFNSADITLAEFQNIINTPIPFETPGMDFVVMKINNSGHQLNTSNAGNDANNSSLTVTSATTLDGSPESYAVEGTFTCKAIDEDGATVDVTNGEFSMVYLTLQ